MANEDEGSKPGQQQPESEHKFSQIHYDRLKRCLDKKDMTEWNEWRKKHLYEEIWLQGVHLENANLKGAHLERANLQYAHLENANLGKAYLEWARLNNAHLEKAKLMGAHLKNAFLGEAHLENANIKKANLKMAFLANAHLENANLQFAHLENTDLTEARLENANLRGAYLEKAILNNAHLENACLEGTHLEMATLKYAHLENACLGGTHLEMAILWESNLRGARFWGADIQGAFFSGAIVDGETLIWDCDVDNKTILEGVGLDSARIEPGTKQLLKYNIRRMSWEDWYKGKSKNKWIIKMHQFLTLPVRLFWSVSNYGLSTWRIIFTFFALAFFFAVAYWRWPNFVAFNGKPVVENFQSLWHAFYFSVVTMTTLGFGDIAANPGSWKGQGLLMLQVILGYVLLGAMITRFAVLFTAGGPAGKFSPRKTKEKGESE